jgi:hypothetical protein
MRHGAFTSGIDIALGTTFDRRPELAVFRACMVHRADPDMHMLRAADRHRAAYGLFGYPVTDA